MCVWMHDKHIELTILQLEKAKVLGILRSLLPTDYRIYTELFFENSGNLRSYKGLYFNVNRLTEGAGAL